MQGPLVSTLENSSFGRSKYEDVNVTCTLGSPHSQDMPRPKTAMRSHKVQIKCGDAPIGLLSLA